MMTPVSQLHGRSLSFPVLPSPFASGFDLRLWGAPIPRPPHPAREEESRGHILGDTGRAPSRQHCSWWRARVHSRISPEMNSLVRLEKMHFYFLFQAKRICLLHKEGSEPVIIAHHTLGAWKWHLATLQPRICGGYTKHYIIAAALIPTINAKKQRQNGPSPRNCHNLRVKWNPNLSWRQLALLQMLKIFFFF